MALYLHFLDQPKVFLVLFKKIKSFWYVYGPGQAKFIFIVFLFCLLAFFTFHIFLFSIFLSTFITLFVAYFILSSYCLLTFVCVRKYVFTYICFQERCGYLIKCTRK
jgi:hypothetical protein